MSTAQLELPLFEPIRSTPDNPVPEQDRTHPAQMIIKHCGKAKKHVEHAYRDAGWWGCPGSPDLRERFEERLLKQKLTEDRRVREMELLTYDCGLERQSFHDPHPHPNGGTCPGLTTRHCGNTATHTHHRWWIIPAAFYWCDGELALTFRAVEDVDLP